MDNPFEYRDTFFLTEEINSYIKKDSLIEAEISFDSPFSPGCKINIIIESIVDKDLNEPFIFSAPLKDYVNVGDFTKYENNAGVMDMKGIIDIIRNKFTIELCDFIDLKNKEKNDSQFRIFFKEPWLVELSIKRKEKLKKLH